MWILKAYNRIIIVMFFVPGIIKWQLSYQGNWPKNYTRSQHYNLYRHLSPLTRAKGIRSVKIRDSTESTVGLRHCWTRKTIRPHHHTRSRWSSVSSLTIQRVYLLDRETPTRLRHKTQKINGPLNYNAFLTKAWNQVMQVGKFWRHFLEKAETKIKLNLPLKFPQSRKLFRYE